MQYNPSKHREVLLQRTFGLNLRAVQMVTLLLVSQLWQSLLRKANKIWLIIFVFFITDLVNVKD
jgi:hypothetical protein